MKNFSDFNQWIRENAFSDLTALFSRAVSRVTSTRNDIYRIQQDYVSAYNSVQTLGYNGEGKIEDQTSADRLAIPRGVLDKASANLLQQIQSLSIDRDQFKQELVRNSNIALFSHQEDVLSDSTTIFSFGGVITVLVTSTPAGITAQASVPSGVAGLLATNITAKKYPRMPNMVFNNNADNVAILWSNAHAYPDIKTMGDMDKSWRVVLFRTAQNKLHLLLDFDDNSSSYGFHFTDGYLEESAYRFDIPTHDVGRTFHSEQELYNLLYNSGVRTITNRGFLQYSNGVQFIPYSSLDQDLLDIWSELLDGNFGSCEEGNYCQSDRSTLFGELFDKILTITPDNLVQLTLILQAD